MIKIISICTIACFSFISCSKNNDKNAFTVDCSTITNKLFAADVNPIIQASCNISGCHASGSNNRPGAITNYAQVFASKSDIRASIASGSMPKGRSLSAAEKSSIICWIDNGAPNN